MSSTPRPRTAREILAKNGRIPAALAASLLSFLAVPIAFADEPSGELNLPAMASAEEQQPAASAPQPLRDPTKPVVKPGDEPKVQVSEHMTVDLHVKEEDLANVLQLLSIQTQKNIISSKNVSAKVTATLYGVTFYQALDAILHVNGFRYMENGNFIYVYTKEEYDQIQAALRKRVAKVVRLNYLNAKDAREFVSPMLSKDGGEIKAAAETKEFAISDKTPVGADSYALGSTLVIIDFEENIAAIESLLKELDTRPAQVLVEATILQTALNENNAFGVDFSIIGDLNFVDFINAGGPLSAANNLIRGGDGSSGQGFSPPTDRGNAVTSTPGNTGGPGTLKLGLIGGDVSVFVRMLDEVTDTVILSNPKVLALNRQPARVLVGRRVGYLNTTSTETSTTQTVEFLDTGTQLYFRPFVSSEGEIRMELKPQVSTAEIRTVTTTGNAAVTIPDEITQELVTNVNVKDGQTIVLGGLFTESTQFTRRQVPWVGDIPIIGAAFRGNEDEKRRAEIIFLVTPSIVTDQMIADSAMRAEEQAENVRSGSRQGLLPWSRERMTAGMNLEAEKLAREGNTERALWLIQRSLSMNPNQPEVYRLRERITGLRERWPNMSANDEVVRGSQHRNESLIPQTPMNDVKRPYMARPIPLHQTGAPQPMSSIVPPEPAQTPEPTPAIDPAATASAPIVEPVTEPEPQADPNSFATAPEFQRFDPTQPPPPDVPPVEPAPEQMEHSDATPSEPMSSAAPVSEPAPAIVPEPTVTAVVPPPAPPEPTPAPTGGASGWIAATPLNVEQPKTGSTNEAGHNPASPGFAGTAPVETVYIDATPKPVVPSDLPPEQPVFSSAQPTLVQNITPVAPEPVTIAAAPVEPAPAPTTPAPEAIAAIPGPTTTPAPTPAPTPVEPAPVVTPVVATVKDADKQQITAVQQLLPALRSHIEMFSLLSDGRLPKLGTDAPEGWGELVTSELMSNAPANVYVGGENARKIVVGTGPDSAFHSKYGWIYNAQTGQLWAVGFDDKDQPLPKPGSALDQAGGVATNEPSVGAVSSATTPETNPATTVTPIGQRPTAHTGVSGLMNAAAQNASELKSTATVPTEAGR
jgi:type IV pilus assembly protein PilQ